jgi:glutaredoxin|tara:strand:+ start:90 stop:350 length:261 start_codon:yes stop_codon:yes gene_type:complete
MKTIVWSKDNCPFCVKAKDLLDRKGIAYEERKLGKDWDKSQLLEAVPDAKTVPQVFLEGKLVGGYDGLIKFFEQQDTWETLNVSTK